ncbi:MAG: hypothetical protein MJZ75_02380 [Paludibacteraceae bacterium]|nr:hypothetical protein [Paludibacteraceae bacterium]
MKHPITLCMVVLTGWLMSSCSITQAVKLKDCQYSYSHISDITFMDMVGKERRSIAGIAQMTRAIMGKTDKVTLGCTIHLKVNNPNKQTASMDRLFYTVALDSIMIAEGCNTEAFIVAGESSADMPLKLSVDIKTLLSNHSRSTVINMLKNFLNMSDTPSIVTVNLKPVIRVAGVSMAIPKSIPLTFEYGGKRNKAQQ